MQCSTAARHFVVLVIDHREAIQHNGGFSDAEFAKFKSEVMAVLTDPDFGFPAIVSGSLLGAVGLLASLEVTDYSIHANERPAIEAHPEVVSGEDQALRRNGR
jgi:hypothetical protein